MVVAGTIKVLYNQEACLTIPRVKIELLRELELFHCTRSFLGLLYQKLD